MRVLQLFLTILLAGCAAIPGPAQPAPLATQADACPATEAARLTPPDDEAVANEPMEGAYIVNEDSSIWAMAWWTEDAQYPLRAGEDGNKVGWFRPAGIDLEITGRRLDAQAPALEARVPCCYLTRFQSTGLYFPAEGCWEITARAGESRLTFMAPVEP